MKLDPLIGRPNPELAHISRPQKVMLLVVAVGLIVLIGVLIGAFFYLPTVSATLPH